MPKHHKAIAPEVLAILQRSEITASTLLLPPERLTPKMYRDCMKVIDAAGGKWSRTRMLHEFTEDPRAALGLALASGSYVDERGLYQFFPTPAKVAKEMAVHLRCHLSERGRGNRVLEPSAGDGAIAMEMALCGLSVSCVELQPKLCQKLRDCCVAPLTVIEGDFLAIDRPKQGSHFDGIAMNPPFQNDQDAAHVLHAWEFLKVGGMLVAIVSPRYTWAETEKAKALAQLFEVHGESCKRLPAGTFKDTDVVTHMLVFKKTDNRQALLRERKWYRIQGTELWRTEKKGLRQSTRDGISFADALKAENLGE